MPLQPIGADPSMTRSCVCFTSDTGYIYPTFAAARQALAHVDRDRVDVVVLGIDLDPACAAAFGAACARAGIRLATATRAQIGGAPAMLARLFLAELLPANYRQIFYMDGDITIHGSLMPLFDYNLPPGSLLAANDPMTFALEDRDRHGESIRRHFETIGMTHDQASNYFNSGTIMADRVTWMEIGSAAWATWQTRQHWQFSDQDVLNLNAIARHIPLSLAWNFPIYMRNARVEDTIRPRVVHYMSKPKPWDGAFPPWTSAIHRIYLDTARQFPEIAAWHRPMPVRRRLRYHAQQRYKRMLESITWGLSKKRCRILDYERRRAVLSQAA
jgi:lipopolysaccharide biosynthesis glycosyltransferase